MPKSTPIPQGAETHSEDAAAASKRARLPKGEHVRGLMLVGLFKLSKAIFFGAVAAGALHLVHRDIGGLVMQISVILHFNPEGHFVGMLMDKADLIDGHHLRQAGALSAGYAICCLVEGIGLMMQQVWAEYFTVILTVAALPYEGYEIVHHYSHFKVGLLVLNLLVLGYLVWLLRRKRQQDGRDRAAVSGFRF